MAAMWNSAILNLAILDSAILVFPLKVTHTCQDWFPPFAQKNFTHSFWLNLMMAAILKDSDNVILDSHTLLSSLWFTQKHSHSTLTLTQTNSIWLKLIHFHLTWWWQPSWKIQTLSLWIQTPCYLLSDSLKNNLTPLWLWLKLILSDSNSFILTQVDDGSHLEFCHLEFGHLGFRHLSFPLKHSHTCQDWFPPFAQKNFTHSFWPNLMMAAIMNSVMLDSDTAILDWDTLLSSLRFTQKHSHTTLTLTQTNSIWLKLIHFYSTWWWQPSWKIQTLPFCLQTPCYLLSDSLKNTVTPL